MSFILQQGGSFAIGTAGHCVEQTGQAVTLLTLAPGTENPVLVGVGSVITFRSNGIGDDFALVSIRPELNSWVDPTIAVVGGPCGGVFGLGSGERVVPATGWPSAPARRRGPAWRSTGEPPPTGGTARRSSVTLEARFVSPI